MRRVFCDYCGIEILKNQEQVDLQAYNGGERLVEQVKENEFQSIIKNYRRHCYEGQIQPYIK